MNWPGGTCISPESLLDARGRRIFWAWAWPALKNEALAAAGWSGVLTLPRVLSLGDDGKLRIEPPAEFERLRLNPRRRKDITLDGEVILDDISGACLELAIEIDPGDAKEVGLIVRRSPDGEERTVVTFVPDRNVLRIDTSRSSLDAAVFNGYPVVPMWDQEDIRAQEAPFELPAGQPLRLRVFLDRSILEAFANCRQCVTQRIYPSRADSVGVALVARGGRATVTILEAWEMAAANPW